LVTGESLKLKVIILDYDRPRQAPLEIPEAGLSPQKEQFLTGQAALYWRTMNGKIDFRKINLSHLARGVYKVSLPTIDDDFEYYIKAVTAGGEELYFPATAPQMNQTVVVVPLIQHDGPAPIIRELNFIISPEPKQTQHQKRPSAKND
jgi:hypothetical protein